MKTKRILSLLLCLMMALSLLPTTALAVPVNTIKITMTQPKAGQPLPTDAQVTTASTQATKIEWTGATDGGLMRGDTAYMIVQFFAVANECQRQ